MNHESDVQKLVVASALVIISLVIGFGAGSSVVDNPSPTTVELNTFETCTTNT